MATFAYVGKTRQGSVKKGEVAAKTRGEAFAQLRKQQVVVTSLQEKAASEGLFKLKFGGSVSDKDIVVFTRQFATMINAKLPSFSAWRLYPRNRKTKLLEKRSVKSRSMLKADRRLPTR